MKKLLIKSEFILVPFSPFIPGVPGVESQPEKWTKGEEVVFELPQDLTDWTHHPAVEAVVAIPEVAEVAEVKEWRIIDQTQGPEEELQVWLSGNIFKYPEGYVAEWIDLTDEWNQKLAIEAKIAIGQKAKQACENVLALISGYNLNRELNFEQISAMQENFAPIEKALQSGRPSLAKAYITQVVADGVFVTQEMKDMALFLLAEY